MSKTTRKRSVTFPEDVLSALDEEASRRNISTSELIRQCVDQVLNIRACENALSQITEVTEASLEKVVEPYMKRIIALIQKNGKIEAAAYFLLLNLILTNPNNTRTTMEVIAACNKLAVDYIKQPNGDIEKFFSKTDELAKKAMGISRAMIFEDE